MGSNDDRNGNTTKELYCWVNDEKLLFCVWETHFSHFSPYSEKQRRQHGHTGLVLSLSSIDHIRILNIELELACNGG